MDDLFFITYLFRCVIFAILNSYIEFMILFAAAKNVMLINEVENIQCERICDELMKQ